MKYSFPFPLSPEKTSLKNLSFFPLAPFGFHWISLNTGRFSLYVPQALEVTLRLYPLADLTTAFLTSSQVPEQDIVSFFFEDLPSEFAYSWQIRKSEGDTPEFADPWNPLLAGQHLWKETYQENRSLVSQTQSAIPTDYNPKPLVDDLRIYECHVRAASQQKDDRAIAGFYTGLIPLLDHIQDLNFNAIELLPVQEFAEQNPSGPPINYWGYMPRHPQCLMRAYSATGQSLEAEHSFALFIAHAHQRHIRVILDLVFNHLDQYCPMAYCLGDELWLKNPQGTAVDYTGCGNTLNSHHPIVYEWIRFQLYYWVFHLGVDGFRFDLACALYRQSDGSCVFEGSLLHKLRQDPWLKDRIWINEPWDAGGAWDLGNAYKWGFFEWNDRYRDDVRRYIHFGDRKDLAATRLCGSSDLFPEKSQLTGGSLQYLACHDGFCLRDLVTYNEKHNLDNGEQGRDGHQHNISFNYGIEGPTQQSNISQIRENQIANFMVFLAISKGPIMMLAGDEYGHTRKGNNNPWCQDNELNALDWKTIEQNPSILQLWKALMHWRSTFPLFQSKAPWNSEHILWHGLKLGQPLWEYTHGPLSIEFKVDSSRAFILFNPTDESLTFEIPADTPWQSIAQSPEVRIHPAEAFLPAKTSLLLSYT